MMTTPNYLDVILGVLVPIITSWLSTVKMDERLKTAIAGLLVITFSLANTLVTKQFDFSNLSTSLATIALVALGAKEYGLKYFQNYLEKLGPIKDSQNQGGQLTK